MRLRELAEKLNAMVEEGAGDLPVFVSDTIGGDIDVMYDELSAPVISRIEAVRWTDGADRLITRSDDYPSEADGFVAEAEFPAVLLDSMLFPVSDELSDEWPDDSEPDDGDDDDEPVF